MLLESAGFRVSHINLLLTVIRQVLLYSTCIVAALQVFNDFAEKGVKYCVKIHYARRENATLMTEMMLKSEKFKPDYKTM